MIYILFDNATKKYVSEINNQKNKMNFKNGWFLFDQEKTNSNVQIINSNFIMIDDGMYEIRREFVFKHPLKAEICYLKLKINEMKKSTFDFFMPHSFEKIKQRLIFLETNHPEYLL
jgi:hypothetical protein